MIRMLGDALVPAHQQYLLQARQMQALSFAVHIPLVAFGISFPALILFAEAHSAHR
jgi:cytochrome d ubiquinol oxidase subunit I